MKYGGTRVIKILKVVQDFNKKFNNFYDIFLKRNCSMNTLITKTSRLKDTPFE